MKNLLLVLAFMLSMGAFAQKPVDPPKEPETLCYLFYGFTADCMHIVPADWYYAYIKYDIQVCDISPYESTASVNQRIQDYLCEYGVFPSYVKIIDKRYAPPPTTGTPK
ncbi:hypothetical protein [Myroides odoratus]|uniref:Uncharacterized protein n=1 Tax=Myroides odoratus TaxID=256 RepID=A0A378RQF8_MYROD|nr:hypothetical protein [Myroides odoratus]QQU04016.1 hypothetical protein I6I89_01600 [Myroides odoratus]STZ28599.1 Uncharacterised protein [Myroides odoratus]